MRTAAGELGDTCGFADSGGLGDPGDAGCSSWSSWSSGLSRFLGGESCRPRSSPPGVWLPGCWRTPLAVGLDAVANACLPAPRFPGGNWTKRVVSLTSLINAGEPVAQGAMEEDATGRL